MTKLRDVAILAGVSESAASVILNGSISGTRVSAQTRQKVMAAAAQLGYRPHSISQSIGTKRKNMIAVYCGRGVQADYSDLYGDLMNGIFQAANGLALNTLIHTAGFDDASLLNFIGGECFDGLIIHALPDDPIVQILKSSDVPTVGILEGIAGIPSVVLDHSGGALLQVKHLAARGHRNFLLKGPPLRMGAVRKAIQSLGFFEKESLDGATAFGINDVRAITESSRATAIVAWSERAAHSICGQIVELGMSIPEDAAIVALCGGNHSFTPKYDLTTNRATLFKVGFQATQILMDIASGKQVEDVRTVPVCFYRGTTS